jgi:hypothetical protein
MASRLQRSPGMKSSWPIVFGFVVITFAAVWYDARNEARSGAGATGSSNASAAVIGTR